MYLRWSRKIPWNHAYAASVDAALAAAEKEKAAHYAADGCTGPDGPLGPSKGTYRTLKSPTTRSGCHKLNKWDPGP